MTQPPLIARITVLSLIIVLAIPIGNVGAGVQHHAPAPAPGVEVDIDHIHLNVHVDANGNAVWVIEHRSRLHTADREEAFVAMAQDIEESPGVYVETVEADLKNTAAIAAAATGRDMRIEVVTVEAHVVHLPQRTGVVSYHFQWIGFAEVDENELLIGDAIAGLFLDPDASLRINWPAEYEIETVQPTPDVDHVTAATWYGPTDFGPTEPDMRLRRGSPLGVIEEFRIAIAIGLVFGVLTLGFALWGRRRWSLRYQEFSYRGNERGVPVAGDETLLSNGEQVLAVLEAHGGRMKQRRIGTALEWSETKASDVLSKMDEDEQIVRFRLGRENVVSLPDEDPR